MKLKIPITKPRNPFAEEVRFKKSGVHGKSTKAKRKAERDALKKGDLDLV